MWWPHHASLKMYVCLYVCVSPKFCGHCISRANARNVTKFYILLYLDKNWGWLDIGGYRLIGGAPMLHFRRTFRYLKYLISLGLFYGYKPISDKKILIRQNSFCKIFVHIELHGALLLYIFLGIFLILYISRYFA